MKIIVYTQYRENYGSHDWDGKGVCPDYWKNKGGDIYVVEDVTVDQAQDCGFWEDVEAHFSTDSLPYWTNYVVSSNLVDDCEKIRGKWAEEWEEVNYSQAKNIIRHSAQN